MRPPLGLLPVIALALAVSGCGDDSSSAEPRPEPAPSSETSGTAATDRCGAVTAAQLSEWAGQSFDVTDDGDGGCQSVGDVADPLRVTWTFKDRVGTLAEDADYETGTLSTAPVRVGGVDAVSAGGAPGGEPLAIVVAPVAGGDEEIVTVTVVNNAGRDAVPPDRLLELATRVAEAYVGSSDG